MDSNLIFIALLAATLIFALASVIFLVGQRRLARRIRAIKDELVAVSGDASVGRRLSISDYPDMADLARTINQLFDALGERDEKILGRDRLFRDFARTLPEIVLVHDDRILLANESAELEIIGIEYIIGREKHTICPT